MSLSGVNLEKYRIPLDEIRRVTRNFSTETLIGDGGFGLVHKGQLSEERKKRTVAIKRLNRDGYQGNNEFRNELEMVSSFHHPNIISFVGYCDEGDEMIIVYDFAKNGSLDHHLQNPDNMRCLTWAQRVKICLGAAKGLNYLHSGLGDHNRVIHRDMKSANILLDEKLEAKICDFGLSRFGARNQEQTQLLTKAAGTRFYMDPLYVERSRLTKESDVYSFGVVMFEMSSGTLVYREKCFGDDAKPQFLLDVVRSCYDDDKNAARPDKLIDPILRDHIDMKSFHVFNKIAHECVNLKLERCPPIARIIRKLEQALHIQINHYKSTFTITTRSLHGFLIPLEELKLVTQNFNEKTRIREHKYHAVVHRGQLHGQWQNCTIAITRFFPNGYTNEHAFKKELQMIANCRHENISPLIGCCYEADERILVHEHAVNGSLVDYLENGGSKLPKLTWAQRLKICLGAARGLQHLHLYLEEDHKSIRGQISSGNILLDEALEAKTSFFHLRNGHPSDYHRSDMYSFGVIMFEILSGEQADDQEIYGRRILQNYVSHEHDQFIDDYIKDQIDSRCLKIFQKTAYQCIKRGEQMQIMRKIDGGSNQTILGRHRHKHFTMDDVVERIEEAADFEENGK